MTSTIKGKASLRLVLDALIETQCKYGRGVSVLEVSRLTEGVMTYRNTQRLLRELCDKCVAGRYVGRHLEREAGVGRPAFYYYANCVDYDGWGENSGVRDDDMYLNAVVSIV